MEFYLSCSRKRRSEPALLIEKIVIFDFIIEGNTQIVTYAALRTLPYGGHALMKVDDVQAGTSSEKLFKTQTGSAQFLSVEKSPRHSGRTKNNSRVGMAVGLIVAAIVCVTIFMAVWYIKKRLLYLLSYYSNRGKNG